MKRVRIRRATGAIAACAVVLAAGCGGAQKAGRPPPAPSTARAPAPTDDQLLRALLERRANALVHARSVRKLGVTRARYGVSRVKVTGRRARLRVRLSYAIRGVAGDFGSARSLLARKAGGTWRIARAQGTRSAEPWEVDDYVRRTTPHFVVWTPRDIEAPVAALEDGYDRLRTVFDHGRLRRRYLVVVARDSAHARRLTRTISGLGSLTAISDTQVRVSGAAGRVGEIGSQRLIIVYSQFATAGATDQRTVVTHELTHAALAPTTSARVPGWLVEGMAMYVSGDDRRAEYASRASVPTLAALSAPDAVGRTRGDTQAGAYATASTAAHAIAERYGRERLLDLYEVFLRSSLRGRRGDPRLVDRATRRILGVSAEELQESFG